MQLDEDAKVKLFHLEQWIALLLGVICLAAAAWGAHTAILASHASTPSGASAAAIWCVTVAVALAGLGLPRFAFLGCGKNASKTPPAAP